MRMKMKMVIACFLLLAVARVSAQQQMPQLPVDAEVRMGKLENGLTYYIRHNDLPKGQVDMHIAQKVGAVQEEDNQRGLAHFLEHMCFNGTEHFPGNTLVSWLETIGVKFGMNLNAATYPDKTVYDITCIPTTRESAVDSCLLILHDWADGLLLETKEIDKERGVIHEEWRTSSNAMTRIIEKYHNELYPNCKYGQRLPIGTMEVIDNFPPKLLRDYYETWYRPDLQGIVVVGDIDVDKMEAKIKEIFGPIKMPEKPGKFEYIDVPDNDDPVLISQKDKEMSANLAWIMIKYDELPRPMRNTDASLINSYMENVMVDMLNRRFAEMVLKPNASFGNASTSCGIYLLASTKKAFNIQTIANSNGNAEALKAALTEVKRVADHGFTAGEYDRVRAEYLSLYETAYNDRNKRKNDDYAQEYINNFIDNTPIPGIEYEYNKIKQIAPMITVDMVNQMAGQLFNGKNMVVISTCPEKDDVVLPTVAEMKAIVDAVKSTPTEAYQDNTVNEPLISQLPAPGKIVSEKENTKIGYTEWTLSNGVRVLLKPTTLKDDEILMSVTSKGGASLYPAADYVNIAPISSVWSLNGVDKFTYNDLEKMLSGKQVDCSPYVGDYEEGINGKSTQKDLETLMQLLYLNFTAPRYDKQSFEVVRKMIMANLENIAQNPQYVFKDSLNNTIYGHNPKAQMFNKNMAEKMDYDRMYQIYKERFANAADFEFVFCGNIDMDKMRTLVEQYVATLPASKGREKVANDGKTYAKGIVTNTFKRKTETNQAMLAMIWSGNLKNTMENRAKISITGQLMSNELLNRVRENEGAAYSPYAGGAIVSTYEDKFVIESMFGLNPDKREISEKLTIACLEDLAKNIPETELNKMKEFMVKQYIQSTQDNGFWVDAINSWVLDGLDKVNNYKEMIEKLTPKEMQSFISSLVKQGNRIEVIMMPE